MFNHVKSDRFGTPAAVRGRKHTLHYCSKVQSSYFYTLSAPLESTGDIMTTSADGMNPSIPPVIYSNSIAMALTPATVVMRLKNCSALCGG